MNTVSASFWRYDSFSDNNPHGKASMTMKPIEEAMEDDVFEGDSANDIQNSPELVYEIPDDIWTDIWWTAVWR